ncbi:MAG: carbon-nitrogen family hydrolase [Microthrixaceae bacterium]|nr:carbon-nitrogen family hydrolase [Microthrixaceae bacterium]
MIVAAIQHDISWRDAAATRRDLGPMVERAAASGARLIVLPEMYATGFSMDAAEICEPEDGASIEFVRDAARRLDVWIAASVAVATKTTGNRNRFIAAGPNGEFVTYDKRHPFTYAGEHREFTPGDDVVRFEIDGLRVTPFVCYDLRFADDFWQAGPTTDLFLVVANWPSSRRHHWSSLLVARAIENQCYVVGVNRVGSADGLDYTGDSAIIAPDGEVLVTASTVATVLTADVEASTVAAVRARFPFLQDRR